MLRNYISVIIQNILRNKVYALINILGLSIGLTVCVIIMQYVRFERSYDNFHSRANQIYRIALRLPGPDGSMYQDAANVAPLADVLRAEYPEVKNAVRIVPEYSKVVFRHDDRTTEVTRVYYADSSLFSMFDYKVLSGDAKTALRDVNTVALSKTTAEKYFGPMKEWTESPVGKIIVMNNHLTLKVTAIMDDFPVNTHFKTNALISFATFVSQNDPTKEWGWNDFYTYVELAPGTDYKQFQSRIQDIIKKHKDKKDWNNEYVLQPLRDIHLHSNIGFELDANGSAESVYFLSTIALIILVVAWVNYINLATARAGHRAKEIGVRKVNGATRRAVIVQFLLESFFMNFVALVFALGMVSVSMPLVSELLGKPLAFSIFSDRFFVLSAITIFIVGSLASGVYPAIVLSSFRPARIFKATPTLSGGNPKLRQALVVFQFMITVGLITGTMIIGNQMKYIQNKSLGYSSDNTIVLSASSTQENDSLGQLRYYTFRNSLLSNSEFTDVAISSALPGKSHNDLDTQGGLRMVGENEDANISLIAFKVDENFIPLFKMKLIAGTNFSDQYRKGDEKLILNRRGAERLGFSDPEKIIGKKVQNWGQQKEVVGVIENYHHKSLKNTFEPMVLRHVIAGAMLYVTVKLDPQIPIAIGIAKLKQQWETVYPNDPFVYSFLEDHVKAQYQADQQFMVIFNIFSGFSMFIACLGLFGLVSYSVTVRIKEIGIRKVLGASIPNIMLLFGKGYIILLLISFLLGIPLAAYVLGKWIDNFAYKTDLGWTVYVIPMVVVTTLSFIAVSVEIIKAAIANPVKSLRCE